MFNLENEIQSWKRKLRRNPAFEDGDIAELESHLRDEIEWLKAEGLSAEEAFQKASEEIGEPEPIGNELYKSRATQKAGPVPPWKQKSWVPALMPNYLKVALRNSLKQKTYFFINIIGLAIGIACCLLIVLYVQFEFSFDTFHEHSDRTYRVTREITGSGGEKRTTVPLNYSMADMLTQNFPEIEAITRFSHQSGKITIEENQFDVSRFYLAESSFFNIFDVEFLSGNPAATLKKPFSAVITREAALRIFKEENPVNKTFEFEGRGPFTVTGVVKSFPANSHLQFDILASLESSRSWLPENAYTELGYNWIYTYLLLPEGYNPAELEQKIRKLIERMAPVESRAFQVDHILQPMEAIHLHSNFTGELQPGGNALTVYALIGIAGLILLIACFNYVNLSTTRAIRRAREVGMRKSLGATRSQLIFQFLGESVVTATLAFMAAILLLEMIVPYFNAFTNRELVVGFLNNPLIFWSLLVTLLFVGVAAGSYPAMVLSGYEPSRVLKGQGLNTDPGRSGMFRKGMVAFQFAISIFLITATVVIYSQLQYAQNKNLGFDKEQIVVLDLSATQARQQIEGLKQEVSMTSGVENVAVTSDVPPASLNSWRILPEGAPVEEVELMSVMAVDENFLELMDINLVEGRNFSWELASDREEAILLNQTAVKWLGLESPIGTRFNLMNGLKQGRVIGVVENFHLKSIHEEIAPVFLHIWPSWYDQLVVKIKPGNIQQVMSNIEEIWNAHLSEIPMEYAFLDKTFDALYQQEERMAKVVAVGASLAIFIACLGLLGLIAYTVERKKPEIGIRKVLGATVANILGILSGEFLKLFIIGFVVTVPVSWYIMNGWLQDFAYRIEIGFGIFAMAGSVALIMAMASIGFQAVKAAMLNPVESLRSE